MESAQCLLKSTPQQILRHAVALICFLWILGAYGAAFANTNAKITNGNAELRASYPAFGLSTLYKFRLTAGSVLAIIPAGARVEVQSRKIIAGSQEWFETVYTTGRKTLKGWVYGGEVGQRKYIRLDPGVDVPLRRSSRSPARVYFAILVDDLRSLLSLRANAQTSSSSNNVITPPPIPTNPVSTWLLNLATVVVFIGSLFIIKKYIFANSNTYSFATSLGVLLIFGVLSQSTFRDTLTGFVLH